ncbi:hypothetical protein FVE85_2486 [Porphyridium purpureum]|uniref:RING-CH-type domain-containing protein n=1 Tax=Porphyridium purpureum TaxID=35688 RepID=A0A5J4YJ48_PORPP|nr:hypothetical protein FVE85_2486 [Porphyridium purpureum]|eukprot:POR5384..scf291_13
MAHPKEPNRAVGEEDEEDEERLCRYCFEGAVDECDAQNGTTPGIESNALVSPCACMGGQRYVHLQCLRRWQRSILVSQPTHPSFYHNDPRLTQCAVCLTPFSVRPPTRQQLMEGFTGAELAALIAPRGVIAAHMAFSAELQRSLHEMPALLRIMCGYQHWIGGAYLITSVEPDSGTLEFLVEEQETLDALRERLVSNSNTDARANGPRDGFPSIVIRGRVFRLAAEGALQNVAVGDENRTGADDRGNHAGLISAFNALSVPARIVLHAQDTTFGEDHVVAVNLTRRIPQGSDEERGNDHEAVKASLQAFCEQYPHLRDNIELEHYDGGPCEESDIQWCITLGGEHEDQEHGWTVHRELTAALQRAARNASLGSGSLPPNSTFFVGDVVQVRDDGSTGVLGVLRSYDAVTEQWEVVILDGHGGGASKKFRESVLRLDTSLNGENNENDGNRNCHKVRVMVFWGDARWSRTQLLGEIARGHWGLAPGCLEVLVVPPRSRRAIFDDQLVFAPTSEMTDEYMRGAERDMEAYSRQQHQQQVQITGFDSVNPTEAETEEEST